MSETSDILARLERHATDMPEASAVHEIATGVTTTWSQLNASVKAFARELDGLFPPGSVLLICNHNTTNFYTAYLGSLAAGMVVLPVPSDIARPERAALAAKSSAAGVINLDLTIESLRPRPAAPPTSALPSERPALLLQSSGTTGLPKIVRREMNSLDAVAANMVEAIGITAADRVLACVPLCHSYGLEHGLLAPIYAGATIHLARGFDLATIRSQLSDKEITVFPAVPSIFEMLGNLPESTSRFPSLRTAYSAGGPLPASVFEKIRDVYGVCVAQLYGATEIGSVIFTQPTDPHFDSASVGRAMNGVELRCDPDGQLLVRASSMMSGYVGDPSPITPDGFFPTGDLARIDSHGNLFITGRLKLLIDVGGLKVNPMEVEQTMLQHPAVAACVVVPMQLSETVFRLRAIITPVDPAQPPATDDLRQFVKQRLSTHKVPRVFELRDELPRSATGKILRHLLVESA